MGPPPEQTDRRLWKDYLPEISFAGGYKMLCNVIKYQDSSCNRATVLYISTEHLMFQKVVAPKDWKLMEMSKTRSRNKLKSISNPSHTTKLLTVARHKVHWRSALVLSPHILWKSGLTSKEDHIKVTCTDICHKKAFQYDVHSPLNNRTCFSFTGHHQVSLRGPLVLYRGQVRKALYSEIQCIMGTTVDRQTHICQNITFPQPLVGGQ